MNLGNKLAVSVVCWGDHYNRNLDKYFLGSLLAPGNLPAIHERIKLFILIASPEKDFEQIRAGRNFQALQKFAEIIHLTIPECPPGVHGCTHMGLGHIKITEWAHENGAFLSALPPDMVLSDGLYTTIADKIEEGFCNVYATCMRCEEESFIPMVDGFNSKRKNNNPSADPFIVTAGEVVDATMHCLHSQCVVWDASKGNLSPFPVAPFWPLIPGKVWRIHSFHWVMLCLDYRNLKDHDQSCLEDWTMDGDYLFDNFRDLKTYIIRDSAEGIASSWAPAKDRPVVPAAIQNGTDLPSRVAVRVANATILRNTFRKPIFDKLKRKLFPIPIYWHVDDASILSATSIDKVLIDTSVEFATIPARKNLGGLYRLYRTFYRIESGPGLVNERSAKAFGLRSVVRVTWSSITTPIFALLHLLWIRNVHHTYRIYGKFRIWVQMAINAGRFLLRGDIDLFMLKLRKNLSFFRRRS